MQEEGEERLILAADEGWSNEQNGLFLIFNILFYCFSSSPISPDLSFSYLLSFISLSPLFLQIC